VLKIRAYREGDAPILACLFFETVRAVNLKDYSPEQVRAWAPEVPDAEAWHERMSGRCTLVAEWGGEVVGFAELEEGGHLDMLYVRADAVGRGVGTRLLATIEEEARRRGMRCIFTEASITARPVFERRGYRVVREQRVVVRGVEMTNFAMEETGVGGVEGQG
jgi:putative acetyltransferase